jgi:CubicO group peptidase (beta-lactamase class C family)
MPRRLMAAMVVLALLLVISIASVPDAPASTRAVGFPVGTPESQGVDPVPLAEAMELVVRDQLPLHGLLIVRHGVLVFEAYAYPYRPETTPTHDIASVTKSVTSILTGIAIDKGYLPAETQPVLPLLKLATPPASDPRLDAISLANLLTMTSGSTCGLQSGEPELFAMRQAPDWIDYAVRMPMRVDPGSRFAYCSVNNHMLSAAITAQTGQSLLQFAQQHLFKPLDIRTATWPADPKGRNHGWGDLHLDARDMAKLGQLYLQRGRWHGTQVVSERWVSESLKPHVSVRPGQSYGYSWWINVEHKPPIPEAIGRGGQRISIIPDKDTVLVFLGGGLDTDVIAPYVLRALRSDTPLPPDRAGTNRLRQAIKMANQPPRASKVSAHPPAAARVSGRVYNFPANAIDLRSATLSFPKGGAASFDLRRADWVLQGPVGLDGVYRFSNTGPGGQPLGARGRWRSPSTFELDIDMVANINRRERFERARRRLREEHSLRAVHADRDTALTRDTAPITTSR